MTTRSTYVERDSFTIPHFEKEILEM